MSVDVARPRKYRPQTGRALDYLYDSVFIVSGARDYARTAFKAAMGTAQKSLVPVYTTMFTDLATLPRLQTVVYPNCRVPEHMDTSYQHYVKKVGATANLPTPDLGGKDLYKYITTPKKLAAVKIASPDFHPTSPRFPWQPTKPRNRGTQSLFRESSAQTVPWQPDEVHGTCLDPPEVLHLEKLMWGPGKPYRAGDLPADFHTTEIINKMRHARIWTEVVDTAKFPRWMKSRGDIISDIETKDWIFRQAEIDELQSIRLTLLRKLQNEKRVKEKTRTSLMLTKMWDRKKKELMQKVELIHRTRDREIRKLTDSHNTGGRVGLVQRMRANRGMGSAAKAASDPTSDLFAPVARHGYQARNRHVEITYNPDLLLLEDHEALSRPPPWLERCGQDLKKTCSGHQIPRDEKKLCQRETKWSEGFLEKLHDDLRRTRLGAATALAAVPLYVLKQRRLQATPRPKTPELTAVEDSEENNYQMVLHLQKIIRGRAVQYLMYEGRTRAAELTEELKTTHGLQKEDKIRIAKEEAKARDYNAVRTEVEKREDAVTALVDELCGGAVSAALDFLEKELRRLKEERRQHAFIIIAMREKQMREAAEAGRRQKEEHRRREHDEMFKQVLGVTQDTVESYLEDIIQQGVAIGAEEEAIRRAEAQADLVEQQLKEHEGMSTAEQNELVAELVHQFLLPATHKTAAKKHIEDIQRAKLEAARNVIFGLIDDAEIRDRYCTRCGNLLDESCRCNVCPVAQQPVATVSRDDPRWKKIRTRPKPKAKRLGERFPPAHEFRCMLNVLIDEVVVKSRQRAMERELVRRDCLDLIEDTFEKEMGIKEILQEVLDVALGVKSLPVKKQTYHHLSRYIRGDAIERTEPLPLNTRPKELPSELRRRQEEEELRAAGTACPCPEKRVEDDAIGGISTTEGDLDQQDVLERLVQLDELDQEDGEFHILKEAKE